jgi:preprotein translocase SecE subunit
VETHVADSKNAKAKSKKTAPKTAKQTTTVKKSTIRRPVRKKEQTVRERAKANSTSKNRRVRTTAGRISAPIKKINPLKGKRYKGIYIRGRRIRIIPRFLVNSWNELRQVTWPDWRTTWRLTLAVFIFAVIFAVVIGVLDYVIGKIFKEVIIK